MNPPATRSPSPLLITLAFLVLYVGWGTTYLAIKRGVKDEHLPPGLFGGLRIASAGVILLAWLACRRQNLRLSRRDLTPVVVGGCLMFVGGNGLITLAEKTVPSGVAAVLAATTPLWIGLFGLCWPGLDRPGWRGWLGLLVGLLGVLVLLWPQLQADLHGAEFDLGPLFVLGSAAAWALGSVLVQRRPPQCDHLTAAAYQMFIGGIALTLVGLACGEVAQLPAELTPGAVLAFTYLLVVGSLMGFVAFNWLLGHVGATRVSTYAYVNPVVAVLVGWLVDAEKITEWLFAGVAIILLGVALIRNQGQHSRAGNTTEEPLRAVHPSGEPTVEAPSNPGSSGCGVELSDARARA